MSGLGMLFAAAAGFADGVGKYNERELQREREAAEKEAERQFRLDMLNRRFENSLALEDHKAKLNKPYKDALIQQARAAAEKSSVATEGARDKLRMRESLERNGILCDNGDEDACAAVKRLSSLLGLAGRTSSNPSDTPEAKLQREIVKKQMDAAKQVYADCMATPGTDHAVCARKAQEAASAIAQSVFTADRPAKQTLSPLEFINQLANTDVTEQNTSTQKKQQANNLAPAPNHGGLLKYYGP